MQTCLSHVQLKRFSFIQICPELSRVRYANSRSTLSVTSNATLMTSINNKLQPPTTCLVAYNQTIIIKFETGSNPYSKLEYIAEIMPVKSVTGEQEASSQSLRSVLFLLYIVVVYGSGCEMLKTSLSIYFWNFRRCTKWNMTFIKAFSVLERDRDLRSTISQLHIVFVV